MDVYTNREIVQYIREGFGSIVETLIVLEDIERRLHRIETKMTDLSTAETDLANAVAALATRLQDELGPLQDALAAAQAQVTSDDATIAADNAQIAQLLADAQTAADSIEAQVTALNALDTVPVQPTAS